MATGQSEGNYGFDLSHPNTATVWSPQLALQYTNNQHELLLPESGLVGEGQDYAFCYDKDLKMNDGGTLHKTLLLAFDHEGRTGAQTMENHEGGFDEASFEYSIAAYRAGGMTKPPLSEKLVAFNLLDNYTRLMGEWSARRDYYIVLALLAGATGNAGTGWTDHTGRQIDVSKSNIWTRGNAVTAPASDYHYRGTFANSRATDEAVVSGDEIDIDTIMMAERLIRTQKFPLRPPLKSDAGKPFYPWLIGPKTAQTMAQDADIQAIWNSLLQGGFIDRNPWFSNAIGSIRNFVFFVVDDMPPGVHSSTNEWVTTTERSVILGCNALSCQYTKEFSPSNPWKFITGTRDGGFVKFMHLYSECGWAATRYTDPKTSSDVDFKYVFTHYTG